MPDAAGNFRGIGWSRKSDAAWDRAFAGFPPPGDAKAAGRRAVEKHGDALARLSDLPCIDGLAGHGCSCVPHEPPHENLDEMADRAEAAGWGR